MPAHPKGSGRVLVVGAGVIGLTCAVRLAEAGFAVDVLARDLPAETTSNVAGGLWLPPLAGSVGDIARWARASLAEFTDLAKDETAGVRMLPGHLLYREPAPKPFWAARLADVVPLTAHSNPAPGYGFGWELTAPMVDVPRYLTYLTARLIAAGGTLTRLSLTALPARGLVVNCTGLAARALAADPLVRPTREQTVVVANPGLRQWSVVPDDAPASSYVLPRSNQVVVLGGTAELDNWSTAPDPGTGAAILERAASIAPQLRGATVLAHRVGLRPARPTVRLELEGHVIHCYGHSGSGFALSWGCADDVLTAATETGFETAFAAP